MENNQETEKLIENEIPIIDSIINSQGYNKNTWKFIILTGFYIFAEGSQLTLISSLFFPLKNFYNLSDSDLSLVSSLMFIGVALGSILSNTLSELYPKRPNLIFFMAIITISNFFVSLYENFLVFTIFRIIIGFSVGAMLPMIFGILTEYLPLKNRGFTLMAIWLFFGFGGLYVNLTMLILMPNLEKDQLNNVIYVLTLPYLIFSSVYYFYIEEGPRKLILLGQESTAFEILEKIQNKPLDEATKTKIIQQVRGGINHELSHNLKSVFHEKFLRTTVIQTYVWICFSYIFYGGIFSLSLVFTEIGFNERGLIEKTILVYAFSMPGNIIGGILSEVKSLGRLKTCQIGYGNLCFFMILLPFFPNYFEIFLGILGLFLNISFNITSTYCSEIYPTQIRDTALGYLYFTTRISAFLSQYISLFIIQIDFRFQYFVILFMSLTCFILIFFLPIEPLDMALDQNPKTDSKTKI